MMMDEVFDKYCYIDEEEEQWKIKEDAPEEAKELFKAYMNDSADGITTN